MPLWRSDAQCSANYPPELAQTHALTFGTWIPHSGTGTGRKWGDDYQIRSAYAGGLTTQYTFLEKMEFGENLEQLKWIKKYSEEYLKVRPFLSCDFYPLTELVSGSGSWCAAQYNRPENGDGIVQVFRRERSAYTTAVFPLFGLECGKTYQWTDADDGATWTVSGEELMDSGLRLTLPVLRTAKLYFYYEVDDENM